MTETAQRRRGGKAFHSILEPHFDFIRQLRQRRKTWQEIADLLLIEKGVRVTLYAPYHFYRRRLKRASHWEHSSLDAQPVHPGTAASRPERGKPTLAAIPVARPFRQPKPDHIHLNDPNNL